MTDVVTYRMHVAFADVLSVFINKPVRQDHGGHYWMAGEIKITFGDESIAIIPFSTDHHQKAEDVPELLVSCVETDVSSKIQEMQAKLAIIAETARA